MSTGEVIGWDIGGAHVKAARLHAGRLVDAAQWPCPLWQGLEHLERALDAAAARWPDAHEAAHAVTMTGEMTDLFADRAEGVGRIAAALDTRLRAPRFFAGERRWAGAGDAAADWPQIASANWRATAQHVAQRFADREGMLIDIGSTTTDLIAFRAGRVATDSRSDADRLMARELVYHGVVRTPPFALARRLPFKGQMHNVMNEFFATMADVYRLTGELDPAHDQQPSADGRTKDLPGSCARLARLIGRDACEGTAADWRELAQHLRELQLSELRANVDAVALAHGLARGSLLVVAGCGAFMARQLAPSGWQTADYGTDVAAAADAEIASRADVAAPAVAVASLLALEMH